MTRDLNVNKPKPIVPPKQLEVFNRSTDAKLTIKALEAGKAVLITAHRLHQCLTNYDI